MRRENFPILDTWGKETIPWAVAEVAYVAYVSAFGNCQTLERIAERGGFATDELDLLYPEWRAAVPTSDREGR